MLVKTYGCAVYGIEAIPITVETNISRGINFHMVGLPDNAVKESQKRIKAAFTNSEFKYPGKEITVNLAPADIRKEGSAYDLTIAVGILSASGQIKSCFISSSCCLTYDSNPSRITIVSNRILFARKFFNNTLCCPL